MERRVSDTVEAGLLCVDNRFLLRSLVQLFVETAAADMFAQITYFG